MWPNKKRDFSKTRRSQKARIKASPIIIPFNFFHHFLPNQKNKINKNRLGTGNPAGYFYQKPATKILAAARIKRPRSRRRNFKRKPKPKAPGRCFWPRILTKKPWKKRQIQKLSHNMFYFCCRASILRILRKFWKCYEKRDGKGRCLPVSYCQR